jgi:hypothetical protein
VSFTGINQLTSFDVLRLSISMFMSPIGVAISNEGYEPTEKALNPWQ